MEQQLKALKRALELGADIDVSFHTDYFAVTPTQREEQEQKIKEIADLLGVGYVELGSSKVESSKWFRAEMKQVEVFSHFHEENKDERAI